MSPDELQREMREIDYGRFEDKGFLDHLTLVGKGLSLLFEKGIYEGKYLRTWLDERLASLGVRDLRRPPARRPGRLASRPRRRTGSS